MKKGIISILLLILGSSPIYAEMTEVYWSSSVPSDGGMFEGGGAEAMYLYMPVKQPQDVVVTIQFSGSANDSDFVLSSNVVQNQITIPANSYEASFDVVGLVDSLVEDTEQITMTIVGISGSASGIGKSYSLDIWDDTTPATASIKNDVGLKNEMSNFPNPFNPTTTIKFSLLTVSQTNLSIYNSNGQLIRTVINDQLLAGQHAVEFDATNLHSGIYFCKLTTESDQIVNKMILVK